VWLATIVANPGRSGLWFSGLFGKVLCACATLQQQYAISDAA
jgi:hypothetical protein